MAKKDNHIHRLKRKSYKSGNQVYFCTKPDCYFKVGVEFSLGKIVECWRCGTPFVMNPYSMRLAKPHCNSCHNNKLETKNEIRPEGSSRLPNQPVQPETAESTIDELRSKLSGISIQETNQSPIEYRTMDVDEVEDPEL